MSVPTTSIFFNKTTPAAPSGQQIIVFATNSATPQQSISATDPVMVGDTGSGGLAGNLPAPPAGSGAAGKVLRADGTWGSPSGGGGGGSGSGFPFSIIQDALFASVSSNVTSYTVTFPQALQSSGATSFLVVSCDGSATVGLPSGWTVVFNQPESTYARLVVLMKTSAEDTSAAFTHPTGSSFAVHFFELSGTRTVGTYSSAGMGNNQYVVFPFITPSAGALVMGYAAMVGGGDLPTPTAIGGMRPYHTIGGAYSNQNGGRLLAGIAFDIPVFNANPIAPPNIYVGMGTSLYGGGGVAYATLAVSLRGGAWVFIHLTLINTSRQTNVATRNGTNRLVFRHALASLLSFQLQVRQFLFGLAKLLRDRSHVAFDVNAL